MTRIGGHLFHRGPQCHRCDHRVDRNRSPACLRCGCYLDRDPWHLIVTEWALASVPWILLTGTLMFIGVLFLCYLGAIRQACFVM